MKNFYGAGHAMPEISPHVETHNCASLRRRRSKHTSSVQRGEVGIPRSIQMYLQMLLSDTRRGAPGCAPISHTPNVKGSTSRSNRDRRRSTPTILLLCFLCLFNHAPAQSHASRGAAPGHLAVTPLQIGDTISESLWHLTLQVVNHPEGRDTITLNDYRHKKLIVLDFWATWCGPCIESVQHIHDLIGDYGLQDEVALIPLCVFDTEDRLHKFISRTHWDKMTVLNDQYLVRLLLQKYREQSGVVWIYGNTLYAVPRRISVTAENLQRLAKGDIEGLEIVNFDDMTERRKRLWPER